MNNSDKMDEIMKRIKKRRLELNLSYQDLADRTGFGKSTLQRYETGSIRTMPIDRFEKLAEALEIEPYKLMGWDVHDILSYDSKHEDDADIIDLYRNYNKMDERGQNKLLEYSFDLISTGKYSKNNPDESEINNTSDFTKHVAANSVNTDECSPSNNISSLSEKFTTIAAHDDELNESEIREMDNVFFNKLLERDSKK